MSFSISELKIENFTRWDAYVRAHAEGTFCHLSGWKTVIEKGARQECPYLVAMQDGKITGVLPLTLRKSLMFGKALTSSMFAVYGGALADDSDVHNALEAAAWEYAQAEGLKAVSYRTIKSNRHGDAGWEVDTDSAATFIKCLKTTPEDILLDIPKRQRAVVRKSLKNGLTCDWGGSIDEFYALYAESVRNLGTPVFGKEIFIQFMDVFGDDVELQVIKTEDGQTVSAMMSFYYKDTVLPYYSGGTFAARKYGSQDFMLYSLMLRAVEKGYSRFDIGRSKTGTGPYKFKKNWGFEPTPLEYQFQLAEGEAPPNLTPQNSKFDLLIKVWKKLPLPVANLLGPAIARHLG